MHYFGAGTSGRVGVVDAAEIPPTFGTPVDWFCAHLAGGPDAMFGAIEDAEDDSAGGAQEARTCVRPADLVIGLAASGRTPYVLGALRAARALGARTALVAADPHAAARAEVDLFIGLDTGPEVVTGSTRMKAASAQKLVLHAFSTTVMVRLGRVYSNLMIDLSATNAKLRGRMISILDGGDRLPGSRLPARADRRRRRFADRSGVSGLRCTRSRKPARPSCVLTNRSGKRSLCSPEQARQPVWAACRSEPWRSVVRITTQ